MTNSVGVVLVPSLMLVAADEHQQRKLHVLFFSTVKGVWTSGRNKQGGRGEGVKWWRKERERREGMRWEREERHGRRRGEERKEEGGEERRETLKNYILILYVMG